MGNSGLRIIMKCGNVHWHSVVFLTIHILDCDPVSHLAHIQMHMHMGLALSKTKKNEIIWNVLSFPRIFFWKITLYYLQYMLDTSHLYATKTSWSTIWIFQLSYQVAQFKSFWFQIPSSFHFVTFLTGHILILGAGAKLLQKIYFMETTKTWPVKMTMSSSNQNTLNNYWLNTHELSTELGFYNHGNG